MGTFVSLTVPESRGAGSAASASEMAAEKTVVVESSNASGVVALEGSQDGVNFAPILTIDLLKDPPGLRCHAIVAYIRAFRMTGNGAISLSVGAETVSNNQFGILSVPTSNGVGDALDVSSYGDDKTIVIGGTYEGKISIQGSNQSSGDDSFVTFLNFFTNAQETKNYLGAFSRVRILRSGVRNPGQAPSISMGGGSIYTSGEASEDTDVNPLNYTITDPTAIPGLNLNHIFMPSLIRAGGATNSISQPGTLPAANTIYAIPFTVPGTRTLTSIRNYTRSGAAGNINWSIYNNRSDSVVYPGTRLFTQSRAVTPTNNQVDLELTLTKGIYWLTTIVDAANIAGLNAMDKLIYEAMAPTIGSDPTFSSPTTRGIGLQLSYSFGEPPIIFPTGASVIYVPPTNLGQIASAYFTW